MDMQPQEQSRQIYSYLDFREYLRDYYQAKKVTTKGFSFRSLSDRCGFKTKDFILRVMKGDKNLSAESIPMVIKGLGLNAKEATFFTALVQFGQSKDAAEREQFFQKLQKLLKTQRFAGTQHLLAHSQYLIFTEWQHLVIRSLIGMHGFAGDFRKLAALVHPPITADVAKASVELLLQCQLLQVDAHGQYTLTHNAITTGDRTSRLALRNFHQNCLREAAASIDRDPPAERNVAGMTLGISRQGYERIVERLNEFRKEIALIAEDDNEADRVYQLDMVLFPMSKAQGVRKLVTKSGQ